MDKIEQLKTMTGWSDRELQSYILERANDGLTEDEIISEILSRKKPSKVDVDMFKLGLKGPFAEPITIPFKPGYVPEKKSDIVIPFKPKEEKPKEEKIVEPKFLDWKSHTSYPGNSTPEDNGWTDLKSGLNKVFGYNMKVDPLWQLAVIDDAFGDDSKLKMWNANKESEKQRRANEAYNLMMKDLAKNDEEKATKIAMAKYHEENKPIVRKELKELNDKLFELQMNPEENKNSILDIEEEINKIYKEYPEFRNSEEWELRKTNRIEERRAKDNRKDEEQKRLSRVQTFLGSLPTVFKTDDDKKHVYSMIDNNIDMTDEEKTTEKKRLREIVSGATKKKEAVQGAVATKAGEHVAKAIDEADAKRKLNSLISSATKSTLPNETKIKKVLQKAKELGISTYTEVDAKRDLGIK